MRRIILVLVLTALMVAVAVTGSAWSLPPTGPEEKGCAGLANAIAAQEDELPPDPFHPKTKANPGQGEEHSADAVEEQFKERCKRPPK